MPRLVIADDHDFIREAIKTILTDYQIVGEAKDGAAALELVQRTRPDLILLDLGMPRRSGMSIIREIKRTAKGVKILVVTIRNSAVEARKAFKSGADGYFLKDEGMQALRSAITNVLAGVKYKSPGIGKD